MKARLAETVRQVRAVLVFEILPAFKGPMVWTALAGLIFLILPIRMLMTGDFSVNGQQVGQIPRLVYVQAIGYSIVAFLATLFTLCLCLDRTGSHYLRNNDLLILARSLGRPAFYLAKLSAVLLPSLGYAGLGLAVLWLELWRTAGINQPRVLLLLFPLGLGLACLVSLYFCMRNFLGNFMIFFLWLLLLPVIYVGNLWRYYGGVLREGTPHVPWLGLLPQFGGMHAYSLGVANDFFWREETWRALVSGGLWTAMALVAGVLFFNRKRL